MFDKSDKINQRNFPTLAMPKVTEYVTLEASKILPDSLPSGEHCMRNGPITGSTRFPLFACLGQEWNAGPTATIRINVLGKARRSQLTCCAGLNAAIYEFDVHDLDPPVPMAGETFTAYVKVTNKGEPFSLGLFSCWGHLSRG